MPSFYVQDGITAGRIARLPQPNKLEVDGVAPSDNTLISHPCKPLHHDKVTAHGEDTHTPPCTKSAIISNPLPPLSSAVPGKWKVEVVAGYSRLEEGQLVGCKLVPSSPEHSQVHSR